MCLNSIHTSSYVALTYRLYFFKMLLYLSKPSIDCSFSNFLIKMDFYKLQYMQHKSMHRDA